MTKSYRCIPHPVTAERFFLHEKPWPNGVFYDDGEDHHPPGMCCWSFDDPAKSQVVASVRDGDWIVTDHKGLRRPVSPLIFAMMYEPVAEVPRPEDATCVTCGVSIFQESTFQNSEGTHCVKCWKAAGS